MKIKQLTPLLLILLALSLYIQSVNADIATTNTVALSFNQGQQFAVQDEYRYSTYLFTVVTGTLIGTCSLTLNSTLGQLIIYPTADSTLTITNYNIASNVYVNNAFYTQGDTVTITSGAPTTIMWKQGGTIIIGSGSKLDLYFRSDTFTTLDVTANGLDNDYTNVYTSTNITAATPETVTYGFRAWLFTSNTSQTEITGGTPEAQIVLSTNTTGYVTSDYVFTARSITMGETALKVVVYAKEGSGSWVAQNSYITNVLMTEYLQNSVWTFRLYVNYKVTSTATQCSYTYGSSAYRSGINNFIYVPPADYILQMWRLQHGDLIGFIIGGYINVMGDGFYVLMIFGVCAGLYRRYGHFGPVAVFFILFGGAGGLVTIFLPAWAIIPYAAIMILACTFILWRVIR